MLDWLLWARHVVPARRGEDSQWGDSTHAVGSAEAQLLPVVFRRWKWIPESLLLQEDARKRPRRVSAALFGERLFSLNGFLMFAVCVYSVYSTYMRSSKVLTYVKELSIHSSVPMRR